LVVQANTREGDRRQKSLEVRPALHVGKLVVVEPGPLHPLVIPLEPQRLYQVQPIAGVGAEADDVAGVGRNFRLVEHDVEHDGVLGWCETGASIPSARADEKSLVRAWAGGW
jgi:hypothetical protein